MSELANLHEMVELRAIVPVDWACHKSGGGADLERVHESESAVRSGAII